MKKIQIKPIGIGDLKVVKQKLARYEPGEIAHIENVMASESRNREHRRFRLIEEILIREEERQEESLRDLQSTERFELQSETQRTIRSDTRFEAGTEVSGTFGPVDLSAFANFSTSFSKEESDRTATNYAKDVTERTLARLVEKLREERTLRTLQEFEEKNQHGFDNSAGDQHITGVYRWVDKYYRNKVVDYGKRLMYEFIVPEPAAFYLFAAKYHLENEVLPVKPDPPTRPGTSIPLSPGDITRYNYLSLVKKYNVQGVEPPPPHQVVISKAISREFQSDGDGDFWAFTNEELKIPKGYQASYGGYYVVYGLDTEDPAATIQIGMNSFSVTDYPTLGFDGETGVLPLSGTGYNIRTFALNLDVFCTLIPEFFEKWQLETYNAIMNAYHQQLMEYEERLAAAEIQEGGKIGSNNPLINREIEKEELKRSCLTLWTGYDFNNPPGINHNPGATPPADYPEMNRTNAITNAEKIEFFEQAFDWHNITYEFLPYYWGRKNEWINLHSLKSDDPVFEQFLKAGAARVVVPVKLAYTEAVLYYQMTGVIWNGGPIPAFSTLTDPDVRLYDSYLEELEDVEEISDIEQDVEISPDDDTTWLVKVPTTLVWLQGDSELPEFENGNG